MIKVKVANENLDYNSNTGSIEIRVDGEYKEIKRMVDFVKDGKNMAEETNQKLRQILRVFNI